MRVWVFEKKKQKMGRNVILEVPDSQELEEIVKKGCEALRIAQPMVLSLHKKDWETFRFAHFNADLFIESVPFDRLEVQAIIDRSGKDDA
nr:hypothetical protein [bacterium]